MNILVPLNDEKYLCREVHSKAIINTNRNEIIESRTKIAIAKNMKRNTEQMLSDIMDLKKKMLSLENIRFEINEIKSLLEVLINKNKV